MNGFDALAAMSRLKTGDLILFAGPGLWLGRLRWLRRAAWTHVGLVLRRADDPEPLLWEAQDRSHRGTLAPLAARMARFSGRIGVRCLNRPLDPDQCARLEALRQDFGHPRERGLVDLIAAGDDGWLGSRPEHLGDPTDAELVAAVYQNLGLLDDVDAGGQPPGRFRPHHFAGSYGLELSNGYALGPEIVLQEPTERLGWSDFHPQPV